MNKSHANTSKDNNNDDVAGEINYTGGGATFEGYDELILFNIINKLPMKSLATFKSVNKSWQSLIEEVPYPNPKLLISPVRPSSESSIEMKMIDPFTDESSDGAAVAPVIPCHCFDSKITFPQVTRNLEDVLERTPLRFCQQSGMLEPIHGLICFYSFENYGSVVIYNPCTGERTPWLKTRTSEVLESIFREQKLREVVTVCPLNRIRKEVLNDKPGDWRTMFQSMFGFGFESTTKQHKVLCIYRIETTQFDRREILNGHDEPIYKSTYETICEVMTVGENSWRNISNDQVPPYILPGGSSVHVDGFIYWMCCDEFTDRNYEFIMVFDVKSETFRWICIHKSILNVGHPLVRSINRLMEIDGYLTMVVVREDDLINLWIYVEKDKKIDDEDGDGYWTQEVIQMPFRWTGIRYLALKAIPGTELLIIKPFYGSDDMEKPRKLESIYYYDLGKKIFYETRVDIKSSPTSPDCGYYDIMTYYETLLPVQKLA